MKTTLSNSLIELSEATRTAYQVAIATGRDDIARELRVLAESVASLIAKSLRGELEKVSC